MRSCPTEHAEPRTRIGRLPSWDAVQRSGRAVEGDESLSLYYAEATLFSGSYIGSNVVNDDGAAIVLRS